MDQKSMNPQNFSMEQVAQLAGTDAGQKLISLLRQKNGADLQKAMENAAAGNMDQAKESLCSLLRDPKIRELLNQLGG